MKFQPGAEDMPHLQAWRDRVALAALVRVANAASNAFALTREELVRDWREIKEQL